MPELPEVEVLRTSLSKIIEKKIITNIKIKKRNLRYKIPINFEKKLINKNLIKVKRRSKYLVFCFKNNFFMIIHLGMSGVLFLENIKEKIKIKLSFYYELEKLNKHDHVVFYFSNNYKLIYNDPRRFGFILLFTNKNKELNSFFEKLGPEPLSNNFNLNYFKKNVLNKKKNIKKLLLDQSFISGLGNIYVNEILFFSKIRPTRLVNNLSQNDLLKIIYFTKKILKRAIQLGGSSIRNFKNASGNAGSFQEKFSVYARTNLSCKRYNCGGTIKKINISNRSSFFCNKCQI